MAQVYANEFTEQELKDLVNFYKSPLGQKLLSSEPRAIQFSMSYMNQWAQSLPRSSRPVPRRDEEARQGYLSLRIASSEWKRAHRVSLPFAIRHPRLRGTGLTMAEFDVDLFVIGGGSGGVRAARIAAGYGARVMVAEEYRMGGTCVIRGCVPKKLFVIGSHVRHEIEDAAGFGWTIPTSPSTGRRSVANKDKEIARLEGIYAANVEKTGARIAKTRAVLEDAHTLRLMTGEKVTAKYILIATGGAPNHGREIPGIEHVISSNEAFHLTELPKRIVIQGGGYIALEFAGIFAGFGSDVTVIYRGDNILRGFDEDVRKHCRAEMEKQGITIITGCTIDKVDRHGNEFTTHLSSGSSIASEKVMFAIGRHPNVANLGLEKAGVAINPANGGIAVDGWSKTSVDNIYAIGDVTHRINLTPVAIREGHAFADTVFGKRPVQVDHATIPTAVFSQPEVGTVGPDRS
jgi:glutathione reductase (NADPH)